MDIKQVSLGEVVRFGAAYPIHPAKRFAFGCKWNQVLPARLEPVSVETPGTGIVVGLRRVTMGYHLARVYAESTDRPAQYRSDPSELVLVVAYALRRCLIYVRLADTE